MAVKMCTRSPSKDDGQSREIEAYKRLAKLDSLHPGRAYIRGIYDAFEVEGPHGIHYCLVHPPIHMTVSELQTQHPSHRCSEKLLRPTLARLLLALDFLHTEANIIHAGLSVIRKHYHMIHLYHLPFQVLVDRGDLDIKTTNIMLTVADNSLLEELEQTERDEPCPRKVVDGSRTNYLTRIRHSKRRSLGSTGAVRLWRGPYREDSSGRPHPAAPLQGSRGGVRDGLEL